MAHDTGAAVIGSRRSCDIDGSGIAISRSASDLVARPERGDDKSDRRQRNVAWIHGFSSLNGQGMSWCDTYLIQQAAGLVTPQWTGGTTVSSLATAGFKAN